MVQAQEPSAADDKNIDFSNHKFFYQVVNPAYSGMVGNPSGGGAYIVAKENLVAGASLLVDYVLTVSIAAGVAAITSMMQGT